MKNVVAIAALAVSLLAAGCAATGQKLAYHPDGCTLGRETVSGQYGSSVPWANTKVRSGDPEFRTKANCTSNRALRQMVATRQDQQRNNAASFSPELPSVD